MLPKETFWSSAPKTEKRDPTALAREERGSEPQKALQADKKRVPRPGSQLAYLFIPFFLKGFQNGVQKGGRFSPRNIPLFHLSRLFGFFVET